MPEDRGGDGGEGEEEPARNDHHLNAEEELNESRSNEPESIMPTRDQKWSIEPIPFPSLIAAGMVENADRTG